jgi:hypothetical protein
MRPKKVSCRTARASAPVTTPSTVPMNERTETWVEPVTARVMPSVRPRRMNRKASVTMNDGSPVRLTMVPLTNPTPAAKRSTTSSASQIGPAVLDDRQQEEHAGGGDHRPDRQVELTADHQQRRAQPDDAELGETSIQERMPRCARKPLSPATTEKNAKMMMAQPRRRRSPGARGSAAVDRRA